MFGMVWGFGITASGGFGSRMVWGLGSRQEVLMHVSKEMSGNFCLSPKKPGMFREV